MAERQRQAGINAGRVGEPCPIFACRGTLIKLSMRPNSPSLICNGSNPHYIVDLDAPKAEARGEADGG